MRRLSVVIVTYQAADFIDGCLASLPAALDGLDAEIILVDNASTDGTLAVVAHRRDALGLTVIAQQHNRGFAAGNNRGVQVASGELLLFLNPDTRVAPDAVRLLADFLTADPARGAVAPALAYPNGDFQHSAFRFPTLASMALDVGSPDPRLLESALNCRYPRRRYAAPFPIDYALGACFLVSRTAWEDVGPWDEAFFLYYEEVDWFMRLRATGLQAWCRPDARVVHIGGAATGRQPAASWLHLQRSKLDWWRKHRPALAPAVKLLIAADAAGRLAQARRRGETARWQPAARASLSL